MDMNLLMTYLGSSLKRLNADVEKLRSNQYNNEDVLDHASSELIMLQNHLLYFNQISQMEEAEIADQLPEGTQGENGGQEVEPTPEPLTYFTLEELSNYTGKNGNPAYVAVDGVVYNVTDNRLWAGGNHFWGLTAGRDLSADFAACHPGAMVLSVLPVVGYLVQE